MRVTDELYIGVMSGTSLDAVDVCAVSIRDQTEVIASNSFDIPPQIRQSIAELCTPGNDEIHRMSILDNQLAQLFSTNINSLVNTNHIDRKKIVAIGCHGQTVRHMPNNATPYTLQIGNGASIALLTGITTITDFRRADIAAGGQGAPLVPAFHQSIFSNTDKNRVILNIGGMANITIINKHEDSISGFDTGPGNVLLNEWISHIKNCEYDRNGDWSAEQPPDTELLDLMLKEQYFHTPPPKSTGRELFNLSWIGEQLSTLNREIDPAIIQSTLCELSARTICEAILNTAPNTEELIVCGGGVHNKNLMEKIETICGIKTKSSTDFGIDPDFVEAAAFAWLAKQTLNNIPANAPSVTGAKKHVVLGAIYPN